MAQCLVYFINKIVGLGNNLKALKHTRHNLGMMAVDYIASRMGVSFELKSAFGGHLGSKLLDNRQVVYFLKPNTLMNVNGTAIKKAMKILDIKVDQILILHDDLDRGMGKISLKKSGSPE
jgi:PTH1 family peptidyl-tRNA hydrolase